MPARALRRRQDGVRSVNFREAGNVRSELSGQYSEPPVG